MENKEPQIIIIGTGHGGAVEELVSSVQNLMKSIEGFENVIIHTDLQATAGFYKEAIPECQIPKPEPLPVLISEKPPQVTYNKKFFNKTNNKDWKKKPRKLFQ